MHISRKGSLFSRYASRIRRLSKLRTFARLWSRLGTETITTVSGCGMDRPFLRPACVLPAAGRGSSRSTRTRNAKPRSPSPNNRSICVRDFSRCSGGRVYRGVSKAVYFDGVDETDFLTGVPVLAFEADALFFVVLFLVVAAAVFGAGRRLAGLASCARM